MLTQIFHTEVTYSKLFCDNEQLPHITRFWDDKIENMYTHNYTLIRDYNDNLLELITNELQMRNEQEKDFLRIELNAELDEKTMNSINKLPIKPEISVYDYMYINTSFYNEIKCNSDCRVIKAITEQQIKDGMEVDIAANCELMILNNIASIDDFDILPDYQRMGFGSAVLKHLLKTLHENKIEHAYLITESADTAKQMYKKCGFKKVGVRTDIFFRLT